MDTYARSPNHARLDTPWNAFTADDQALVCTLWADQIAKIVDPADGRERRFVLLGGKSRQWKGLAQKHGEEARENLDHAVATRKPIFGYEAEPVASALKQGERKVKHFWLDRVSQLRGWIGMSLDELKERLDIDNQFQRQGIRISFDSNRPGKLFELVERTADIPHLRDSDEQDGVLPETSTYEAEPEADPDSEENLVQQEGETPDADDYAQRALYVLVMHALQQKDNVMRRMTYRELAERLGRCNKHGEPWPRGLGHVLNRVTTVIEKAGATLADAPPFLASVVVLSSGSNAGLPAAGVNRVWPEYASLPRQDKEAKLMNEYGRILDYGSRWNEILKFAGVPGVTPLSIERKPGAGGWGGGESDAHKALKQFIFDHPEICGAPKDWWLRETEYALRSGDSIDVIFKSKARWLGVEVKSRVSDGNTEDYLRGIYQAVKYQAVLQAQACVDHQENMPEVTVVLVLERQLPAAYRAIADKLNVHVIDEISPAAVATL
ncbi:hypothetical protein [Cupriavidus phytorum]|uniref:hypothetical protein n=1 Tax=Cupriavidus phytorum TaxID=3024399 RepID=UPI0011B68CF7|nr:MULTISPECIES: hypothetical protein [Cupriavidus]